MGVRQPSVASSRAAVQVRGVIRMSSYRSSVLSVTRLSSWPDGGFGVSQSRRADVSLNVRLQPKEER